WELIWEHRHAWLGPLANLFTEPWDSPFVFRRGLVEAAALPLQTFLERGEEIRQWCPVLHRLTLLDVRDHGAALAAASHLAPYPPLEIADWLTGEDARALAASAHLGELRTLRLWLGSRHDHDVCRIFGRARKLPKLGQMHLVQLHGGLMAGDRAD